MEKSSDTYKTILKPSAEILFKEKSSKFFGQAFPLKSEDEVKPMLEEIRKKHSSARHVCYAWQLGVKKIQYRANDDGEPNNSAGMPIFGQIRSFEVTNVLVTVARIFGGTKLGVGGLINAYREAAKMALETSKIIERKLQSHFEIQFDYTEMNKVMALITKLQLEIASQEMENSFTINLAVDKSTENKMLEQFAALQKVKLSKLN